MPLSPRFLPMCRPTGSPHRCRAGSISRLIIYTLTMDKVRSIATLKFVGAPDRTIVGLILQQSLSLGLVGFSFGLTLVLTFLPYFPRRVVLDSASVAAVFAI